MKKKKRQLSKRVLTYQKAIERNRKAYKEGKISKEIYKEVNVEWDQYMFLTKGEETI